MILSPTASSLVEQQMAQVMGLKAQMIAEFGHAFPYHTINGKLQSIEVPEDFTEAQRGRLFALLKGAGLV